MGALFAPSFDGRVVGEASLEGGSHTPMNSGCRPDRTHASIRMCSRHRPVLGILPTLTSAPPQSRGTGSPYELESPA